MDFTPLRTHAQVHWDWIDKMGWHGNPLMSSMGLVGSEIGEAAQELANRMSGPEAEQAAKEELVDILLRLMDLAVTYKVDLAKEAEAFTFLKEKEERMSENVQFLHIAAAFGRWVNTARKETLPPEFSTTMGELAFRTLVLFYTLDRYDQVGLETVLLRKIEKNKQRGNKGRRI